MRGFTGDIRRMLRERFSTAGRRNNGVDDAFLEFLPHGGHVAQLVDDLGKSLENVIDVLHRVVLAEAHDDIALGQRVIEFDGAEDVGNLELFADAARSAGDRNTLIVEKQKLAFSLDELRAEIQRIADTERSRLRAIKFDVLDVLPKAVIKALL